MNSSTAPTAAPRSLAEGNRFQRAYYRWALPYYEVLEPDLREQVEAVDRHLYSLQGLGTWLGIVGAIGGSTLGLRSLGMGLTFAILLSGVAWTVIMISVLGVWLRPDPLLARARKPTNVLTFVGLGLLGGVVGMALGQYAKKGYVDPLELMERLADKAMLVAPLLLVVIAGMGLLFIGVARTRQAVLQRQRDRARLVGERDAATAQARQAQLQLLQAQIQPHFIFNTLAALQHWVDRSDPRAAPLLRQVSAFLRAATDMLGKDSVSLTEELTQVEHYLGIMKARWGERLRFELDCDPTLRDQSLPPGLLLTLVENAVEHGLSHQLDGGQVWVEAGLNAAGQIQIQVRDDGAGLAPQWQTGVGLSNVRERLQHHFGPGADLTLQPREGGGCVATLSIPR